MENLDQAAKIPGIDDDLPELTVADELTTLKERADLMGITYHPSIGLEKLRAKVNEAIAAEGAPKESADYSADLDTDIEDDPVPAAPMASAPVQANQAPVFIQAPVQAVKYITPKQHADQISVGPDTETIGAKRLRLKRHANELIRIRVTCMNPAKKEWEGEIFAAGNNLVGTLKKYVPFGADEGWHVPRIMYNVIRDRMAQIFVTVTDEKKNKVRRGKLIREFAIEVLEPLTPVELSELASRQAATRAIDA
jgi:hypothetical protein